MSGAFHGRFCLLDGIHDVRIGGAATEVAAHVFADLGIGGSVALIHAAHRRDDLPRGTIATLECIVIDKGLLHWVQRAVVSSQAPEGSTGSSISPGNQSQTRQDAI